MSDSASARPASRDSEVLLEEQLCFALYSAGNAMTAAYRRGLAECGLTYSRYVVMLIVWAGESVAMTEVCRRLHLDSATLSPVLKRLEADGLVTRRRGVEDERTVIISCTPAGWALRPRVTAVARDVERATGLDTERIVALRTQLHELAEQLRTAEAAASAASTSLRA